MKRSVIHVLWMIPVWCNAQTAGIVFDMESRRPVGGVNVYINPKGVVVTDKQGRFCLPEQCHSVTFSRIGYESRAMAIAEIKDTVWLLPRLHRVDEVVVTAKAPRPTFDMHGELRNNTTLGAMGAPKGGFDFFSLFRKKRSKKKQETIDRIMRTY